MINLKDFDIICNNIVSEIEIIEDYILTPKEDHAVKRLKDRTGVQLVAVIPSADPEANNPDAFKEKNITYFFIIEKDDPSSYTPLDELENYSKTQIAIENFKLFLIDKKASCSNLRDLNINSMRTDPEYRIFGGWNGWSMAVEF